LGRRPVVDHGNVIGAGIRVEGSVRGAGELNVEGSIVGSIELDGDLTVHDGAHVEADVTAARVSVSGFVRGDVRGTDAVAVSASGVVEGAISAPSISVDPKARVKGRFEMPIDLPRGVGATAGSARRR
jgi:cytoskeletal protein CcmA (bactofilin family)